MTAAGAAVRYPPLARLDPSVFVDAPVPMLATTTSGVVVEANDVAATLFGRPASELVQEPLDRHVELCSGRPLAADLRAAARGRELVAIGPGEVRRRGGGGAAVLLLAAGACRELGRDLVLVRITPRR